MNIAHSRALRATAALIATAALAACGGGGGGGGGSTGTLTVSSVATSAPKYANNMDVTVTGTGLAGATISSPGCSLITVHPTLIPANADTTSYYQCRVSKVGAQQVFVTRVSDSLGLANANFTVLVPQVTLTVSNGGSVNGSMVITLAPDKTPITVDNFLGYVNAGFYNGLIFHRVSSDFVIQGGGLFPVRTGNAPLQKVTAAQIALEVGKGLSNIKYSIAMARLAAPDTAAAQFFINMKDNSAFLDSFNGGYAVFGAVTADAAGTLTPAMADAIHSLAGNPATCAALSSVTTSPECTPIPDVIITSAVQTR